MKYSRVFLDSMGYELAPVAISSDQIEQQLATTYKALHIPQGQLLQWTGVEQRRWWEPDFPLSEGALRAAKKALENSPVRAQDLEVLIYAGVCREQFEPATACHVAAGLGVSPRAAVYDISNACLGVMNGILDIANRIELGQIRAGLVVSCESAREINEIAIAALNRDPQMDRFKLTVATFTGGSGAAAMLLTDDSFRDQPRRRLMAGVYRTDPSMHELCMWGVERSGRPELGMHREFMRTDSVAVLEKGVALGTQTWQNLMTELDWQPDLVDRTICHQVGKAHRDNMLKIIGVPEQHDAVTYSYLGNIGTVSVPMTAAIAEEQGQLQSGQHVCFLGIGSGLNCMMQGWQW